MLPVAQPKYHGLAFSFAQTSGPEAGNLSSSGTARNARKGKESGEG